MDIAAPPDPTPLAVARDRDRVRYSIVGALALLAGVWLVWLGGFALGWPMDDLGIVPRRFVGLIGILTAPLAHASFEHLMSNTLPLVLLTTLTLYAYPRAARLALPTIWLLSGIGVWLFARSAVHVGASGITHGLMFFLFFSGLMRRDRLAIVTALVVFFLYGSMVLTVLPQEPHVSFEYHLAGALAGVLSAVLFHRRDPAPPRRRYSWEDEPDFVEADAGDGELEPARPAIVRPIWSGPGRVHDDAPRVLTFAVRRERTDDA
jgi:membrane associated rhomboid family serine protease